MPDLARSFTPLVLATFLLACSSGADEGKQGSGANDAGGNDGPTGDAAALRPRRVVTADWLNESLTVLDYDALVGGAATRDEALVKTVDLSGYAPGPIEVAVAPDGKTAVVTVGPGFFAGALAPLVGATSVATTGTALIVDLEAGAVVKELPPPSPPLGVVITPDGKRAFTVDHGSTEGKTLTVIDLVERKIVESIEVGGTPEEISLTPDGALGVVNTDGDGSIRFFDPKDPAGTLTAPLAIGGDPGGAAFVPSAHKLVIGKSLPMDGEEAGFSVVDLTDPGAPTVLEAQKLPGVPYGAEPIPGTSRVLATSGVSGCALHEIDVAATPAVVARVITLPCEVGKSGLPMSTAIDDEGKYAFVGIVGDNSLMVVDLVAGTARRVPWLGKSGPTDATITR